MYLTNRFYIVFVLVILFLGSGYAFAPLFVVGQWALVALIALVSADGFLLYRTNAIQAERHCADRFSNGDENEVAIRVENSYPRPVSLEIIDEIPFIFQQRNINFRIQASRQMKGKRLVIVSALRSGVFTLSGGSGCL